MSKKRENHSKKKAEQGQQQVTPKKENPPVSFLNYLKAKEQKTELLIMAGVFVALYIVMRITYAYPLTTADSGSYILSAKNDMINGFRPIGYSWFISFFHSFSASTTGLFTGQFLLNAIAQLGFIFSIKYFFRLKGMFLYAFSVLFVLSPSIIFCTNYIMSDSIFHSLTLIYLATALWMIKKPNPYNIILHFVVLYLVINVRYAALFYPVMSIGILLLHAKQKKLYWLVAIIPAIIGFKIHHDTKAETKKVFGIDEFSGFSGWASANNAAAMIPYIDLQPSEIRDNQLNIIHQITTSFPDSVYQQKYIKATSFMWRKEFPGKRVLFYNMQNTRYNYVKAWVYTGKQFKEYAFFLIKRYPFKYIQHYIIPNFMRLFESFKIPAKKYVPDDLSKGYYNLSIDEYEFEHAFLHKFDGARKVLEPALWVIFLAAVCVLFIKRMVLSSPNKEALIFLLLFLAFYAGFSVLAHPINNFRYLIPIYCIQLFVPCLVLYKLLSKTPVQDEA